MPPSRHVPVRALAVGLAAVLAAGACSTSPTSAAARGDGPAGAASDDREPQHRLRHRGRRPARPRPRRPSSSTAASPSAPAVALLGGLDVPWSIAMLPDGSSLVSVRNTGEVHHVPKPGSGGPRHGRRHAPDHPRGRGGRPARAGGARGLRRQPRLLRLLLHRQRQPHRGRAVARRHPRRAAGDLRRHPDGAQPQRRPHRLRPRRLPLRRHRRGRRQLALAEPRLARRQDPAAHARGQARARQPLRRLRHLVLRPPQRAGPGLGQPGPPVGQRVRRQHRSTSSTSSSPARTTAGPRSRDAPTTPTSSTPSHSGRPPTCHPAASRSGPTARSTWRPCVASPCGGSRSTPTARPARPSRHLAGHLRSRPRHPLRRRPRVDPHQQRRRRPPDVAPALRRRRCADGRSRPRMP